MALFDEIKKRLGSQQTTPTSAEMGGGQAETQRVLAGKSGKARAAGVPAASTVEEQAAVNAGRTALAQQAAKGALAAEQVGQQTSALATEAALGRERLGAQQRMAEAELATRGAMAAGARGAAAEQFAAQQTAQAAMAQEKLAAAMTQATANLASERGVTEADLFESFRQGNADLAQRKDAADLEQLLFAKALSDKAYIQNLIQVGQMNRLQNDADFARESQRLILGDALEGLLTQQDWQAAYNGDERAWQEKVGSMDNELAIQIAMSKIAQANAAMYTKGAVTGIGAAAEGLENYDFGETRQNPRARTEGTYEPSRPAPSSKTVPT